MDSPVQTTLSLPDGGLRSIIIEPILKKESEEEQHLSAIYKLFTDVYHDDIFLFTELRERAHLNDDLHDEQNPDYLGKLVVDLNGKQSYIGNKLTEAEAKQLGAFIKHNG